MNKPTFKVNYLNLILFILLIIWLLLIYFNFIAFLFPSLSIFKPFITKIFSLVCHQESDKVFNFMGIKTNVCFRCLGLYWGAFIASFILFFFDKLYLYASKTLFFISLCILFLDVLLVNLGFYAYNFYITFFTGLFLGFICFLYLYKSVFEQLSEKNIDD